MIIKFKPINVSFLSYTELHFRFYRDVIPLSQAVYIYIKNFSGIGTYSMNATSRLLGVPGSSGNLNNYLNFSNKVGTVDQEFVTNEIHNGKVVMTFYDSTSRIISGFFEFDAANRSSSSEVVKITDGRFDCTIR